RSSGTSLRVWPVNLNSTGSAMKHPVCRAARPPHGRAGGYADASEQCFVNYQKYCIMPQAVAVGRLHALSIGSAILERLGRMAETSITRLVYCRRFFSRRSSWLVDFPAAQSTSV